MSAEYGKQISPVLAEIADTLWEIDARGLQAPYGYSEEGFRGALKIFMSVCMDKLWANAEANETPQEDRELFVLRLGSDLRELMMEHLNVDTTKLYENE